MYTEERFERLSCGVTVNDLNLPRGCDAVVQDFLSIFRVVILNGARQTGKSTLLKPSNAITVAPYSISTVSSFFNRR
jgi:hypothetical protein